MVIEDFDWNNEWADSLHVPPQGTRGCECDLTWNLVDEAVGASQSLQGRNFPRAAHRRARNYAPMVDEAELGSDNEENPDPFDEADVTVAPGFKNKTRYTPYVSPGSQISHIATNKK